MPNLVPTHQPTEQHQLEPLEGLTAMQSAFVRAYVSAGTGNGTQAARTAGYGATHCHSAAHRLLSTAKIQTAILDYTRQAFATVAPIAFGAMLRLAKGARSEFVRQQAAKDLLDRAGLAPITKVAMAVKGDITFNINLNPEK